MKLSYERETDTLLITLSHQEIEETDEIRPGVLADFDQSSGLVSLEILNASRKVEDLFPLVQKSQFVKMEVA